MVIDLDKCVACQACTAACRFENNVPFVGPEEAARGRAIFWNEVLTEIEGEFPDVRQEFIPRPCMHCDRPPCVQVCPVGATYRDEEGIVHQNYRRCIGCRYCMNACPYGVRYFNWFKYRPPQPMEQYYNPDAVSGLNYPTSEGPLPRPRGVVEKCTFCIHRIQKAKERARAEGRELLDGEIKPACVQTCTGMARYFGDLDDPDSEVSRLIKTRRAFRLLEELGTEPKVYYLKGG